MHEYTPAEIERFWKRVQKTESCWIHPATPSQKYPQVWMGGKTHPANRIAWQLCRGDIPPTLFVCHNCPDGDNPRCVNPDHLFLGTAAQNSADMAHKGRAAKGTQNGKYTKPTNTPRGIGHYKAKLTEVDVLSIRASYAGGKTTTTALASQFGVTQALIWFIVKRRCWKHI